jgi:tetratricopeptide (TPR) repeat protein
VSRALTLLLLLALASCTNPLEVGERRYREGDRVGALEIWRSVDRDSVYREAVENRIAEVESELANLVVLFKKRGGYYERKDRLAESVLNYRLALKLQPGDRATLDHVQTLFRTLATLSEEERDAYAERFEAGELAAARSHLRRLRILDPFDPRLATDERQLRETLWSEVEPLLARGERSFLHRDYETAENAFRSVLELDPENKTALGSLSNIAKRREKVMDAAETHPTGDQIDADGAFELGRLAEHNEKFFEAIKYYIEALKMNPEHGSASDRLSKLRAEVKVEDLIQEGRNYYQQEDLEAALEQWRNALLIEPGNTQAVEYVARAEKLLENLERLREEPEVGVEAP